MSMVHKHSAVFKTLMCLRVYMQTANSSWSPEKDGCWASVYFEQDSAGSGKASPEPTFW